MLWKIMCIIEKILQIFSFSSNSILLSLPVLVLHDGVWDSIPSLTGTMAREIYCPNVGELLAPVSFSLSFLLRNWDLFTRVGDVKGKSWGVKLKKIYRRRPGATLLYIECVVHLAATLALLWVVSQKREWKKSVFGRSLTFLSGTNNLIIYGTNCVYECPSSESNVWMFYKHLSRWLSWPLTRKTTLLNQVSTMIFQKKKVKENAFNVMWPQ